MYGHGSGSLAMQVLSACSQSILLWGFYVGFFLCVHSTLSLLLCLAFCYYVSVLLVSCYPFYPLWVTGDRDIPWFSLSLV